MKKKMEPIRLEIEDLDFLQKMAQDHEIEFFNGRFVQSEITTLSLLNRESHTSNTGLIQGFSIQTFLQGGWGMATGNNFSHDSIEEVFLQSTKLAHWSAQ
jgi:predicted Zn-dependent protease